MGGQPIDFGGLAPLFLRLLQEAQKDGQIGCWPTKFSTLLELSHIIELWKGDAWRWWETSNNKNIRYIHTTAIFDPRILNQGIPKDIHCRFRKFAIACMPLDPECMTYQAIPYLEHPSKHHSK